MNTKATEFQNHTYRKCLETLTPNLAAELLRYGKSKPGVISLAQGEGDLPTPAFIRDAAAKAMSDGFTNYGPALGYPELRQEISTYHARVFGHNVPTNRIFVTPSGTNAVHMALLSILNEGDEVVAVTPIWKNLIGIVEIAQGQIKDVPMDETDGVWSLDINKLLNACSTTTKAILLATPNNPTGWVMPLEDMRTVMEYARHRGIWVIADEVYSRCVYDDVRAPSFLDVSEPEDRLFIVNSFSKSWAMTGWRLGWLIGPADSESRIRDLSLYEVLCPPSFVQMAGVAALRHGEEFIADQKIHWKRNLDLIMDRFSRMPRIRMARPDSTFYAFFRVEGETDSLVLAKRLIDEAGISLAPGVSFGTCSAQHLRLCFGASEATIRDVMDRLERALI